MLFCTYAVDLRDHFQNIVLTILVSVHDTRSAFISKACKLAHIKAFENDKSEALSDIRGFHRKKKYFSKVYVEKMVLICLIMTLL